MFTINTNKCVACSQCIKDCPVNDILLQENKAYIKNENCMKCGHCIAVCPTQAVATDDYDMSEVKEYNPQEFEISSDNLLHFIQFRRSVRRFKTQEIEKAKLEKIIEAGRFTQTGTNSQDVSYTVVTDKLDLLKDLTYEVLKQKGDYILSHLTPETAHLEKYATLWTKMYDAHKKNPATFDRLFFHAPTAIIVTAYNELNGALASSNMELMADALGLGTFFNGFFQFAAKDNQAIRDLLEIKDTKQIVTCMVIGYPDVTYKRTVPRKKADINWL